MDKGVFRAYKSHWDDELLKYWDKYPARDLNRERFSDVFLPTWKQNDDIENHHLPIYRFEAVNEEIVSDYDANDYLPLETLRRKLNTAENCFSEVLPTTPDLVKSKNISRRKALNYKVIEVKRNVFRAD
ncbi:hypothetical protein Trydic_g2327 [Trypoxylus dichotomus]